MQYAPEEEQFRRVLAGGYSYITFKFPALPSVAATYTNKQGYTPIHISRTEYPPFAGDGWGFRIGAPYRRCISRMMFRLKEGGLINYWLDDVIANHVRNTANTRDDEEKTQDKNLQAEEGQRVLGLDHLQGAFYLLFLGCGVAFVFLLVENLAH
ncbi:uncharacterized protein [Panulirus ornatus]|uniref:uncharacterized protein n=1 Tax=Panulirus ornatus TaxID=150431 RepID=UPI003A8B1DBE